jgi:hypothetical protein
MASRHIIVYINLCVSPNKSVLYWTQVCQYSVTQVKTQLRKTTLKEKEKIFFTVYVSYQSNKSH